jgi:hypothetical protein
MQPIKIAVCRARISAIRHEKCGAHPQKRATCWLGRQDSNLRVPVPKADISGGFQSKSVRNARIIHTAISMTYEIAAEWRWGCEAIAPWQPPACPSSSKRALAGHERICIAQPFSAAIVPKRIGAGNLLMMMVETELRESTIHGIGVFLKERVGAGDIIWRFDSRIDRVFRARSSRACHAACRNSYALTRLCTAS